MIFSWLAKRRRRKLWAQPFPESWAQVLTRNVQAWAELSSEERAALKDVLRVLIAEKSWEGCGGLELTDEIRVTIAAQAGLLLLGLEHEYYRNVQSILVYPTGYVLPETASGPAGLVTQERVAVAGTAHMQGPVILSWDSALRGGQDARDGHNLVLHEFAHKLDMLDGWADGAPQLGSTAQFEEWVHVMTAEYEWLCDQTDRGRRTVLRPYGATNAAEFFAVATEIFFEQPRRLLTKHPEMYRVLREFYRQDPARRAVPNAARRGGASKRKRRRKRPRRRG